DFYPFDRAIAMATHVQAVFAIEHQTVRSWLGSGERLVAGVAAILHEDRDATLGIPLVDAIVGNIAEEQTTFLGQPNRSFGPLKSVGQHFNGGVLRDEFVEGRIDSL